MRDQIKNLLWIACSSQYSSAEVALKVDALLGIIDIHISQQKCEILSEALYRAEKVEAGSFKVMLENLRDENEYRGT